LIDGVAQRGIANTGQRNGERLVNRLILIPHGGRTAGNGFLTVASRLARFLPCGLLGMLVVSAAMSCGGKTDSPPPATKTKPSMGAFPSMKPEPTVTGPRTPGDDLTAELSKILNDASIRYGSLEYEYDENLLSTIDKAEAYLSGKQKGPAPRAMPKMSEKEEYDHLRTTIRRWQDQTGKDFRAEIDQLKAEVAARKPGGPAYHPDFHKRFAAVFDSFIPIEVKAIRERRNRAIHEAAKPLLEKYRATAPDVVKQYEATLNAPPYNLTPESPPEPTAKPPS